MKFITRVEALPVLASVDPADLLLEVLKRGVRVMPPENLLSKTTECPRCGVRGQVAKDFGVRVLGGTVRPQSWCRECRKNPNRMKASKRATNGQKFPTTKDDLIALLKANLSKTQIQALKKFQITQLKGRGVAK